jgi:MFS family permease
MMVGALAIGSATPHALKLAGATDDWRRLLDLAALSAAIGALVAFAFVREGPDHRPSPPFQWRYVLQPLRERAMRLANFGYFGHMWELYAMWAWIPTYLVASFARRGVDPRWASVAAFATIASGGLGSLLAGKWADRIGRTTVTIASLVISGLCCFAAGFLFGGPPWAVVTLCVAWGFAIVADSAQFSACISELCDPAYTGTALALQTSLGFLLTLVTIRLLPTVVARVGWSWAFVLLAPGPVFGAWAMGALRALPQSKQMAGGRR